jgi:hypothetical protein
VTCPAGTYQSQGFQDKCIDCPPGHYCLDGSIEYSTSICPVGYYCPAKTEFAQQYPCEPGTYMPKTGAFKCIPCDVGKYCAAPGLSVVSGLCNEGYYCSGGSSTPTPVFDPAAPLETKVGDRCAKGYFCPGAGVHPKPCPAGLVCSQPGLAKPDKVCDEGFYCTSKVFTPTPSDDSRDGGNRCRPGHYCPKGTGWPLSCEVGTYNPSSLSKDVSACKKCDAGYYCDSAGIATPTGICSKGYFCPEGSTTPYPKDSHCPKGQYCPPGSSKALDCAKG